MSIENSIFLVYCEVDFKPTNEDELIFDLYPNETKELVHMCSKVALTDDQRLVIQTGYEDYAVENKIYIAEHWLSKEHPELEYFSIENNEIVPFDGDVVEGYKNL